MFDVGYFPPEMRLRCSPLAPELEVDIMKASSRNLEDATRSLLFGSIIIALTLAALTPAVARMARH